MEKEVKKSRYPETAKDALDQFEEGNIVAVIVLGGLGPGYEQTIWNCIFKMIRAYHKESPDDWFTEDEELKKVEGKDYLDVLDEKLSAVSKGDGLSGAQAGAIKSTFYQMMKFGWRHMMEKAPKDRIIQISKHFPKYE